MSIFPTREHWRYAKSVVKTVSSSDTRNSSSKKCMFCNSLIGDEHEYECVIRTRQVVLSFNFIYDMPESWSADDIEWHLNCHMYSGDVVRIVERAISDYKNNDNLDTSYSELRESFPFRYVSDAIFLNVCRLGSASRDK